MTKDVTSVFNLALSQCQQKSRVASPTESSKEAETCNLWYEPTRDAVLRAAYWPSTGVYRRLALLATWDGSTNWDQDDPSPDWTYAYGLPSDMIRPRHLTSFVRFKIDWYRPTGSDPVKALMTDQEEAILHYTWRQTAPQEWDDALYMAVVWALAGNIAMPLTGKRSLANRNFELANQAINDARAAVANSEEDFVDTVPEWIQQRGFEWAAPQLRYYYPYGPAFAGSAQIATTSISGV